MPRLSAAKDPVVLSFAALRRIVGYVAIALPFLVSVPVYWYFHLGLAGSISGYYYYPTRNLFVGSLCAIATFMFCNRGYDWQDEVAGIFSAICAFGVAFCPTAPRICATALQKRIGAIHYGFATALFLTLSVFCLYLFQKTSEPGCETPQKRIRNRIYTGCGCAILCSLITIGITSKLDSPPIFGVYAWPLVFESTSLFAFGFAWLVKGETLFQDKNAAPHAHTTTSNRLFALAARPAHPAALPYDMLPEEGSN